MKRFFKKSYSWLATLFLAVAFAVSGNAAAGTVTLPLNNGGGTVDGVSYTYGSCDWAGSTNIYGDYTAADGWGYITMACFTENIVKVELTTKGDAGTVYEYNHNGSMTTNGNVAVWEGSAQELGFTSSADVYITSIVVYTEAGGGEVVTASTEMPLNNGGGTLDGISYTYGSCDWAGSTNIYGDYTAADGWGYITLSCFDKDIVKVELTTKGDAGTVYEYNHNGSMSTSGNVAVWEGSAHELGFTSSADVYITKIVVYTESAGAIVKDCSIDVDHFADNCKPGKVESISKWITLYMQANTLATGWTGGHNCPEGVTFTTEAGEEIPVDQFNYWAGDNQIGVNLYDAITTPGVYTLHIPEGIVVFEGGKFNKEINATWTVVEPDLRPTKDVVFDFAAGSPYNLGTTEFSVEKVELAINENRWNAQAQGFRVGTDGWLTFTAPEKSSLKSIQLLQESSYGVSPDFSANVGEVSVYDKTLYWSGDDASVTLTDNYGTCYFTKAIVTLAMEETDEPLVDANEAYFNDWKALINDEFADIAYENGYQVPEQDVPGKKPAAVVAPCVEYWSNRTAFVQLGFDWKTVNDYLGQLYQTTISEDYFYALELLEAYNAAEVVPEVVGPVQKDKYTIKLNGTEYYFTTTEVKDNSVTTYSISATPEYFYIEPNGNGYTIQSADTEKWVGYDVISTWDFSNDEKVWTIGNLEGEPTYIYKNGSKGFGVDGSFEGAGVYTDKSGQYWVVEKFVEGGEVVDPVDPVDPVDLSIFAGEWFFKGEGAYCNSPENIDGALNPKSEYTVNVEVQNGEIYMTGLIGDVYDYPYAYVGTYDATAGTLSFDIPSGNYGKYIIDTNWEYYIMTDALVFKVEEAEDGIITLVNDGWDFLYEDWYYSQYACGYTSCIMTREQQIVEPEPTEWNGNIIFDEANSLDDLLTYTLEFEEAAEVKAAGTDVLGVVFEANGNPYAIALGNDVMSVFGNVSFSGSKATVEFVKIADLNADLQASAAASAKRIGGFATEGKASVVFSGKSFKVDGQLITDVIAKDYTFEGGAPTGIESINTNANDTIYDLSGRRVVNANGGLYIKNGRKVYMK